MDYVPRNLDLNNRKLQEAIAMAIQWPQVPILYKINNQIIFDENNLNFVLSRGILDQ